MLEIQDFSDELTQDEDLLDEEHRETVPSESQPGNPTTEREQTQVSSGRTHLFTGNGEARTSHEDVIKEAIEIGRQITKVDINGDKTISPLEAYLDMNRAQVDTDGNGKISIEEAHNALDTDGNGKISIGERLNTLSNVLFTDEGNAHRAELSKLLTSHTEAIARVTKLDLNADQIFSVSTDMIKDGTFETAEAWVLFEFRSHLISTEHTGYEIKLTPLGKKVLGLFDEAVRNGLGELPCDLESHEHQKLPYNCGPTTAKMLLERLGTNISEGAITVRAILDGSLTEEKGMLPARIVEILKRFGHDAGVLFAEDPKELLKGVSEYTRKGHLAALPVDGDELWSGRQDDDGPKGDKGDGINHVVWVHQIHWEESVHITDSGKKDGAYNKYSFEQFMNAVDDFHGKDKDGRPVYYAIVTRHAAPPLQCEMSPSTMTEQERNERFRNR